MIVEEAGMVGAVQWKKILSAAEKFEVKLIIVGDHNQLKPISAGDCLRLFVNEKKYYELKEIKRQKINWMREASAEFSKLDISKALELYKDNDKIHIVDDLALSSAKKYLEMEKNGATVVLCYTKLECKKINDIIRSIKKTNNEIGEDIAKLNDRFFSKNDKIIFLKNDKTLNVKNGQTAVVQFFLSGILTVELDSEIKNINVEDYEAIDHAYAITIHKSQGKTFDNTIIVANKKMDSKAFYVAMTRHRDNVQLYYEKTDFATFEELVKSASRYIHKSSIKDYNM